ncbi:hypothetical protein HTS61_20955 [Escherichia coli]|nr:hypothetical protein [Escherichia coli]
MSGGDKAGQKELSYNGAVKVVGVFAKQLRNICHYYAPVNSDWISAMDCLGPPFAGNHNLWVVTGEFFHLLDVFFSVFCWLDSSEKNVSAVKFFTAKVFKRYY